MMRNTRALALPAALCALAGCAEEPPPMLGPGVYPVMAAAELRTVGAPGAPDLPFGSALVAYSNRLADLHAFTGARSDAQIHEAVLGLATALERLPGAAYEPRLRRAAATMRGAVGLHEEANVEETKRALAVAATAVLDLAEGCYRGSPEVAERARRFADAVAAIDEARDPPDRAGVIAALVRGERALAAIYAVNVMP